MSKHPYSNPKKFDSFVMSNTSKWRLKIEATNKLRFNMKPKLKKDTVIGIEYSLDEEDSKSKREKELVTGVLDKIEKGLEAFPDLLGENYTTQVDSRVEDS